MNISQKTIWLAVHGLFRARGVEAGGSLPLKDMMEGWVECCLRQSDLGAGLESLARAAYLEIHATPRGPVVQMLDERFGYVGDSEDELRAVEDLVRVREMRRRPGSGFAAAGPATVGGGRRREDLLGPLAHAA